MHLLLSASILAIYVSAHVRSPDIGSNLLGSTAVTQSMVLAHHFGVYAIKHNLLPVEPAYT